MPTPQARMYQLWGRMEEASELCSEALLIVRQCNAATSRPPLFFSDQCAQILLGVLRAVGCRDADVAFVLGELDKKGAAAATGVALGGEEKKMDDTGPEGRAASKNDGETAHAPIGGGGGGGGGDTKTRTSSPSAPPAGRACAGDTATAGARKLAQNKQRKGADAAQNIEDRSASRTRLRLEHHLKAAAAAAAATGALERAAAAAAAAAATQKNVSSGCPDPTRAQKKGGGGITKKTQKKARPRLASRLQDARKAAVQRVQQLKRQEQKTAAANKEKLTAYEIIKKQREEQLEKQRQAAGQWHALIDCYGRHRRPVTRSN